MKLNKEHIEKAANVLGAARHLAAFGKAIGEDKPTIGFSCSTVRNLAGDALKIIKTFQ